MRKCLFRRLRKTERGVALIEFALVLPILIALVMGIIEFGWLFNGWITVKGAAREGARIALSQRMFEGEDYPDYIEDAVNKHMESLSPYFSSVIVDVDTDSDGTGVNYHEWVIVEVTGTMTPLVRFFVRGPQVLYGKTTMRID